MSLRQYIYHAIFLFLLFLIETAAGRTFAEMPYVVPGLMLLAVVIFALNQSAVSVIWYSAGAGMLAEFYSGDFLGSRIFAMLTIGFVTYFLTRNLTAQESASPSSLMIVGGATVAQAVLAYIFLLIFSLFGVVGAPALGNYLSLSVLVTIVINLVFFIILNQVFRFLPRAD